MSNIFIWVKKDLFWVFYNREDTWQKQWNKFWKREEEIEMSIYSAFHIRDARSLSLCEYLPWVDSTGSISLLCSCPHKTKSIHSGIMLSWTQFLTPLPLSRFWWMTKMLNQSLLSFLLLSNLTFPKNQK